MGNTVRKLKCIEKWTTFWVRILSGKIKTKLSKFEG